MSSGDVTYFCKYMYGRYFLIGYYLSKIENLLLLAESSKENIRFEIVLTSYNKTNNCCVKHDLRLSSLFTK